MGCRCHVNLVRVDDEIFSHPVGRRDPERLRVSTRGEILHSIRASPFHLT